MQPSSGYTSEGENELAIASRIHLLEQQLKAKSDELDARTRELQEVEKTAGVGSWEWEPQTGKLRWSKFMFDIYERDQSDPVTFEKFIEWVHAEDRGMVEARIRIAFETKNFEEFDHRIVTPSGDVKYLHARGTIITNDQGEIVRMLGTGQDVTQRVRGRQELIRANQLLEEQNQFVNTLIQFSKEWITVVDTETVCFLINDAALAAVGKKREDVIGKKLYTEVMPQAKGSDAEKDLLRALQGEVIVNKPYMTRFVGKYVQNYITPVRNASGEIYAAVLIANDLTDMYQAQQELKRSHEHFLQLFNVSPVAMSVSSIDSGKVLNVNRAWENLFGLTHEQVTNRNASEINISDANLRNEKIRQLLESPIGEGVEMEYQLPGGDQISCYVTAEKITIDGEDCLLAAHIDITSRKRTEEQIFAMNKGLAEQNRFIQAILDSTVALIAVYDTDMRILSVNNATELAIGLSKEQMVGRIVHELLPQINNTQPHRDLQKALEGEYIHNASYDSPLGKTYENFIVPLRDDAGKVYAAVAVAHDITERTRSTEKIMLSNSELEERNRFVEQLLDSSLDAIMVIDKDLRLVDINSKAKSMISIFYQGEVLGKQLSDLSPEITKTEIYRALSRALDGEIVILDRIKGVFVDGFFEHNLIPLKKLDGSVYAVMVIIHDITENIRRMDELKKLAESDQLKTDFIKMASHELKTPVTSVKGHVQLLLKMFGEKQANQLPLELINAALTSIDKQVERLTRLMNDLLDLSKIESGALMLGKVKFDLSELAHDVVQDITVTNKRHTIHTDIEPGIFVVADKDRIGQVITNLLANAVKYSPQHTPVTIRVYRKESQACVSVIDEGIGISKEEQRRVFERFYRSQGTYEQTFPGFGIGLFLASEIIHRHGGVIGVESEKGKGSVFTFAIGI